ncbi:MAG TPA: hypothetical protein PLZ93_02270 [Nocardioides sp.]|uniref:hypothetical protein n=1 Tax=uncultured Nocardioides sp. TaxID=198441 RepID=UPI000EEC6777|nr:hypothetical protein [uncultured Nocardioides sp.]HCB06278.1 hypothetical protein [Nocardioides sp.]HRD61335.1 hypothetical protein [Nocardioides sp.]HRI94421.1 hypothetical protein [Nocardioides sp.]HRK44345.1 hypothetical protein [Nocardioides sp.]
MTWDRPKELFEFESDRLHREAMEQARLKGRLAALEDLAAQTEAQVRQPSKAVRDWDTFRKGLTRRERRPARNERGFVEVIPQWLLDDNTPHPYDRHAGDIEELQKYAAAEAEHRSQQLQQTIETRQRAQQGRWRYQGAAY